MELRYLYFHSLAYYPQSSVKSIQYRGSFLYSFDIIIFVLVELDFMRLNSVIFYLKVTCEEEVSLESNQEEADTKVFLCIKHASSNFQFNQICLRTVDSDIGIYALYFHQFLGKKILLETGSSSSHRIIDISSLCKEIGPDCCRVLPALHAFTGNDYTSAFHGLGKVKAYNIMKESPEFIKLFQSMGEHFEFDASTFNLVEKFVCNLYGVGQCSDVNEARYIKFCAKQKATEPQRLTPTRDALLLHCKRVCYSTALVKRSLQNSPRIPRPYDGYGYDLVDGNLEIQWMLLPPRPRCCSETCPMWL